MWKQLSSLSLRKARCVLLGERLCSSKSAPEATSFALNLFRGEIKPDEVFPYKEVLTSDEKQTLQALIDPVEKFFREKNDAAKNDREEKFDEQTIQSLREMGAFGLQVPEKYGGLGLNNTHYARFGEIVGTRNLGMGVFLGAHQGIGFKGIMLFGTEAQKQKYLPKCASGELFAAFCLTEPTSGSDASSIRSRAVPSEDGKGYILNGGKIWISNGGIADVFTVFAQLPIKDEASGITKEKVTAFIVERSMEGVTSGPPEKKMGIKVSNTADVHFSDVRIPRENLLGEEGGGFKVAMNILNTGRFGMAAIMSGSMRECIRVAVEHVASRVQFGRRLDTFGGIQEKIARMTMAHYVTESLAYMISSNMDQGVTEYQIEAAISKVYGSESAWYVADEAIQILGGMGYMQEAGLERVLRDLRIFRIFEGTNDILRLFVALTGIQYAGSHLREVQKAFKSPTANLGLILGEGSRQAKRFVGISSGPSLAEFVHPNLADLANKVSPLIESFGIGVENLLIKHGKAVVDEQYQLNRLANAAIDLYAMSVVLSRASRSLTQGHVSAQHEAMLTYVFCTETCERVKWLLGSLRSDKGHRKRFDYMTTISKEVVGNGGLIQQHPVGF